MATKNKNPEIYHFVYYGYERTVIDSQVLAPYLLLRDEGLNIRLIFMEKPERFLARAFWRKRREIKNRGVRASFLPRIPRNFLWLNTFFLCLYFFARGGHRKKIVLHARGHQGADVLLPLKRWLRAKIICDSRGLEAAEFEHSLRARKRRPLNVFEERWKKRLALIEERVLREADVVFCVSHSMIGYLKGRYPSFINQRWEYIPCAVSLKKYVKSAVCREKARAALGITGQQVVVYAGSLRAWQKPDILVRSFQAMRDIYPGLFFICLTPDVKELRSAFEAEGWGKDKIQIFQLPHEDIPDYLCAGDYGLLIREKNLLNQVALPTKFAEYLASGLHVVTNGTIDDVKQVVREERVGTLVPESGDLSADRASLKKMFESHQNTRDRSARSRQVAREQFDWARYIPILKKWYLLLAHE